jgi:hypothetical protein
VNGIRLARVASIAGLLALGTSCALPPPQRSAENEPGARAPAFDVAATSSGGRVALGDLVARGPLVLVFYRGDW